MTGDHQVTRKPRKFTDAYVRNLKPARERIEAWGPGGLGIRVSPAGVKSWVFMYWHLGRKRRMTLGRYPDLSVSQAHEAHGKAIADRARGVDPGERAVLKRLEIQGAPTVEQLVSEYIERHAKAHKRSWRDDERILQKEIVKRWGKRKAGDVRRRDVIAALDEIAARPAPVMANRTLAALRKCYNWGISRDLVETSPCLQVPRPAPEEQRERYLTRKELVGFLGILDDPALEMSETTRAALRFLLATGQRPGEVAGASWDEIDLDAATWEIPGERTKNGRSHRVPLNGPALDALERARALAEECAWPFPSPAGDRPMRPLSLTTAIRRNVERFGKLHVEPFTAHDLRRTCATNLAALGVTRFVIGRILNHAERGVTRVYDRHAYLEEMRQALELWGEQIESLRIGAQKDRRARTR